MSFNPPGQFQQPGQFKPVQQFQPIAPNSNGPQFNPTPGQFNPAPGQFNPAPGQFKPMGQPAPAQPNNFTPINPPQQFNAAPQPMNAGGQFQPVGAAPFNAPKFNAPNAFQAAPVPIAPQNTQQSATAPASQPNFQAMNPIGVTNQFKPAPSFQPAPQFQPVSQFKPVGQPLTSMPSQQPPVNNAPAPNTFQPAPTPFNAPKFNAPTTFLPQNAINQHPQGQGQGGSMTQPAQQVSGLPPNQGHMPMSLPQTGSNLPPMKQPLGSNVFNPNTVSMSQNNAPMPMPMPMPINQPIGAFNPNAAGTLPPPQQQQQQQQLQPGNQIPMPMPLSNTASMPLPLPQGQSHMAMPLGQQPGLQQMAQPQHHQQPPSQQQQQQQNTEPIIPPHVVPPPLAHFQTCCDVFPSSLTLHNRSQLPQGIVITPFAQPDASKNELPVPLVDFNGQVIRCDHCRAYINPYVSFRDRGVRWVCNFCHTGNQTPDFYLCQVDPQTGYRSDVKNRTELTSSIYEMSAPEDYNTRDPVPPAFIFVINVSASALATGYLPTLCETLTNSLDALISSTTDPRVIASHQHQAQQTGQPQKQSPSRGRIAFITYDHNYHYYEFNPKSTFPQMHVGPPQLPIHSPVNESLLHCNIQECRPQIENFLRMLPSMFASNSQDIHQNDACTATALDAVHATLQHVGGRIFLFTSQLPNVGSGALPTRADALLSRQGQHSPELIDSLLSKDKNGNISYDSLAFKFSRTHFSVDLFILTPPLSPNQNYPSSLDLATLSDVTRLTSGEMYYYPQYNDLDNEGNNGKKESFKHDLFTSITTPIAWEAVYRLRVAGDVMITDLYGNFSIRGSSLIILPSVDSRKTLSFEFRPSDVPKAQQSRCIYIQGALLYTTSYSERRIRVISHCLPTSQYQQELYDKAHAKVIATLLAKQCVGLSIPQLDGGLTKGRQHMLSRVIGLLKAFKALNPTLVNANDFGNFTLLPPLALGFAKSIALRDMNDVHIDARVYALYKLISLNVAQINTFLAPQFYSLANWLSLPCNMANGIDDVRLSLESSNALPPQLPLSQQHLATDGIFLLNNGFTIFIFIGAQFESTNASYMSQAFGISSLNNSQLVLLPSPVPNKQILSSNPVLFRFHALLSYLRNNQDCGPIGYQHLHIIRESTMQQSTGVNAILPIEFTAAFADDANANVMSAQQFTQLLFK